MIAAMPGTNQALATLERMSTRCARDHATQSALILGTNHVISLNLLFYHSRQLFGMLGQGASLYEFLPRSGDWDTMWFYDQDRDKEEMLTAQRAVALRSISLDEDIFVKAVDNMGRTMVKLSGRKYKEQLDVSDGCDFTGVQKQSFGTGQEQKSSFHSAV